MSDRAQEQAEYRGEALAVRSVLGGALMGLANLVPGISGGTMLLAAGVYPQFIGGVAEVSTFRFRGRTVLTLACIAGAAAAAIVLLAGPVGRLVAEQRWIMYSIFIGLTLGGVPVLWSMIRRADPTIVFTSILGIALMALMAAFDPGGAAAGTGGRTPYGLLVLAGIAGGAAMILPGLSGAYLLLILGQYLTILAAIDQARQGVGERDWALLADAMHVFVPLGVGVLVGVVGLSNLMKLLLARYERPTLGVLLGLLLGAVIGLWPFVQPTAPEPGSIVRGERVVQLAGDDGDGPDAEVSFMLEPSGRELRARDWPAQPFPPRPAQVALALALAAAGFATSMGIAHIGSRAGSRHGSRR
jgi:putative membrane protein